MGSGAFLKLLAKNFHVIAGPLVTLAYPLYASIKAIESPSPVDDQQWLTYWVLHSLLALFELTFAKVIEWLPFWPFAKLIFGCWLVLPYFNGAAYVYQHYVRPFLINKQTINIWYIPRKKDIFGRPDDVLLAAEKFIKENGPEGFEKLVSKAKGTSKSNKGNRRVTFDETEAKKESKSWKSICRFKFSEGEAKKETKSLKGNGHVTFDEIKAGREIEAERESDSRTKNNSFMMFDNKGNKRVSFNETEAKNESKPWKSICHFKFSEGEAKMETKPLKDNGHVTFNEVKAEREIEAERESDPWTRNSSFMIFDNDHRSWT